MFSFNSVPWYWWLGKVMDEEQETRSRQSDEKVT